MSVSNVTTGLTYACNGVTTTFAIPFAFLDVATIKVYKIEVATGITTLLTAAVDYTLSPDPLAPVNIIISPAFAATFQVRVQRESPKTQTTTYIDNAAFKAQDHEKGLDKIVYQVQENTTEIGKAIKVQMKDVAANTELPLLEADKIITVNATGDGFILKAASEITSAGGGGVPVGGDAGAVIAKVSATDGDTEWKQYAYTGYSSRFNQGFTSTDLDDTLKKILVITYNAPSISLSASGASTVREKGATVASTVLTATVTKTSDPIDNVKFYLSPSTLLDTKTGTIPTGGSEATTYSTAFTDTRSFYATVTDTGATGGPSTITSNTVTFPFVYPYYSGAGTTSLTPAQVALLTKDVIVSTATFVKTITATAGQVFYLAYPSSYPALTSILDVNGFETITDWTATTISIVGLDGTSQSYRQYKFNNPVTAGAYQYTFKR